MKKMRHTFRVISLGLGLALLVVTGTAAMIGAFSGPALDPGLYPPVAIGPAAGSHPPHSSDDSVLYERVARSDGSHLWVLTEESPLGGAQPGARETLAATTAPVAGLQQVSYALQAKPAGFSRAPKNCTSTSQGSSKPKALSSSYDISCVSLG
ncbi:hypothetical protein [Polaromonas sp.]|uniref:hypothetical protein n=1 Tax=Polaromonas sp. TaxID=1869339 RepID=UPI0032642E17